MRLSLATLGRLSPDIARPEYDRQAQAIGIVHFGLGAFHRAHQAWYMDLALSGGERDWTISGISLRSPAVAEQLNPQDGLYTMTERSTAGSRTRAIGSVREALVASRDTKAIVARLAAPETKIISFTVTEKGYGSSPGGNLDHAAAGRSFYPLLAQGLRLRQVSGLPGLTLLSCDNLPANGRVLERLLSQWLDVYDPGLADWVDRECTFPCTMVDRIVPATVAADITALEAELGLRDHAAVFAERFSQWVIEDRFAGPRPSWENYGVEIVSDAAPYETAKLRMLNAAHSALAYCGLEHGHTFVHEAIGDRSLRPLVERLLRQEAATSFIAAPGQDLSAYADALIARFADPAINHSLAQIAMDGSQKIPQRWLDTLAHHQRHSKECPALLQALAAWLRHVRGIGHTADDPMASTLARLWRESGAQRIGAALFTGNGPFAQHWQADERALAQLARNLGAA